MKTQLDKAGTRFLFFKSSSLISLEMIALSRQICSAASPERPRGNARAPSARLLGHLVAEPLHGAVCRDSHVYKHVKAEIPSYEPLTR